MGQPYPVVPSPVPGPAPDPMPRTVLAAGLITIASCLATIAAALLFGFVAYVASSDSALAGDGFGLGNTVAWVGILVWSVVGIVLAALVMRRSQVARLLLVVSAVAVLVVAIRAIGFIVTGGLVVASLAVLVLLFTGGANAWFARRPAG
ncbi:MAG: hypothetical protein U0R78_15075 [Nocardioidaceae bacterium]